MDAEGRRNVEDLVHYSETFRHDHVTLATKDARGVLAHLAELEEEIGTALDLLTGFNGTGKVRVEDAVTVLNRALAALGEEAKR